MGLEDDSSPPKKKLKQAQLSFANASLKNQKRKLSADNNDDLHLNKIVCKETEKENVELNSKTIKELSEKRTQPDCDTVSKNVSDKLCSSVKNESDGSAQTPPVKEESSVIEIRDEDKSLGDFSLIISDSVLNSINHKNVESGDKTIESSVLEETSDFQTSDPDQNVTDEMLNESQISTGEDLDKTTNSEDDFGTSSEESPINKISPNSKRKLTPKRLEYLKRREEKERLMLERKTLRAKAKEEKLKLKQEKLDMKRKEREEKEKKRIADLKIKEEEKRLKEEEKKQKEEEKRLKEEEKKKKEEAKEEEKRKKGEMSEKEKAAFANFFISKKKQLTESGEKPKENEEIIFMPFPMKSDMRLATEPRHSINKDEKMLLDSVISNDLNDKSADLYLKELKSGLHTPKKSDATWPLVRQEEDHDVIIIESTANGECVDLTNSKVIDNKKKIRAKLLQFHDNRRPPYWGTWRKKSNALGPRKPLGLDKEIFDYEVDSDSEWEDEGEGEDIDKEGDSDEEPGEEEDNTGENGYLLDNTFVPHGYLSDEEVHPDDDVDDNNPENLKLRMKLLKQEFDEEMKSKTERLKPRLLGCVWISNGITEVSTGSLYETLMRFRAIWNEDEGCIDLSGPEIEESPTLSHPTRIKFPLTMIPVLAKFIHGSHLPFSALVKEFLLLLEKEYPTENISKRAITLKIKEIANKTYDSNGKSVWSVNSDLCKEFGLKAVDSTSNILPSPQPVIEKPKESLLVNFLKGSQTPQPIKKRISLIPVDGTSNKNESESSKYTSTPRPKGDAIVKKRAQLITLSRTPENSKISLVHKDTPRPTNSTTTSNETVDLSVDSP